MSPAVHGTEMLVLLGAGAIALVFTVVCVIAYLRIALAPLKISAGNV